MTSTGPTAPHGAAAPIRAAAPAGTAIDPRPAGPAAPEPDRTAPAPTPPGRTAGDTLRTTISVLLAALVLGTAFHLSSTGGEGLGGRTASFTLLAGLALGIVFERGRFCFHCIFRDAFEERDSRGLYAILTALAVGTLGYAVIFSIRLPDPSAGRLPPDAHIAPVSPALILAGLAFGLGVVISGGCIGGHLYRLGEGSLRAIPALGGTLVGFGLGFLTWNPLYRRFIADAPVPWLPRGSGYGVAVLLQLAALAGIGIWLLRFNPPTPARPERRIDAPTMRRLVFVERWPALATGALVGIIGVFAYLRDRPLGVTSQMSSLTRTVLDDHGVLPQRLLALDQRLAGCVAVVVDTITANGWLVLGIVVGSFAAALPGRRFRIEPLTGRGALTAVAGGVLLGWGAIIGLGCSIGVFLSGTQALAVSGWVFAAAMTIGIGFGFRLGLHRS